MRAPRLVVTALIACSLVVLALQNMTPSLMLTFLGVQTVTLPLGIWLAIAIALGALSAIAVFVLTDSSSSSGSSQRRRWTVQEPSPNDYSQTSRPWQAAPPKTEPSRVNTNPPQPESQRSYASPGTPFQGQRVESPRPNQTAAAENWQSWGQRTSPAQWESWAQAGSNDPIDDTLNRRQQKDRQQADTVIQDLDQGWDDSAQETVYVAPGGSDIDDALDEIADGWDDWESEADPPSETAYSQRYEGGDQRIRQDSIYGPPDDTGEDDDSSVYDADYRVIIPPSQTFNREEEDRDR